MSYEYRYNGDLQTVFIHLRDERGTWAPHKGDTFVSDVPLSHVMLELVEDEPVVEEKTAKKESKDPDVVPDETALPVTADESKEN